MAQCAPALITVHEPSPKGSSLEIGADSRGPVTTHYTRLVCVDICMSGAENGRIGINADECVVWRFARSVNPDDGQPCSRTIRPFRRANRSFPEHHGSVVEVNLLKSHRAGRRWVMSLLCIGIAFLAAAIAALCVDPWLAPPEKPVYFLPIIGFCSILPIGIVGVVLGMFVVTASLMILRQLSRAWQGHCLCCGHQLMFETDVRCQECGRICPGAPRRST